jgi:hypothetical protein
VGFIDFEGDGADGLLFNGNLFKRDTITKSAKVLSSLSSDEQSKITEFDAIIKARGCVLASKADAVLGRTLFEKLKAAAVYEVNTVSNEHGEHAFVNSPGAFHKFVDPLVDDSFDLAMPVWIEAVSRHVGRRPPRTQKAHLMSLMESQTRCRTTGLYFLGEMVPNADEGPCGQTRRC